MEKKSKGLKLVWDNTKLILKKMSDAGSKIGESMEKSIKDLEMIGKLDTENEFNVDKLLEKLPK